MNELSLEQLKKRFEKDPDAVREMIENLVAGKDSCLKLVATDLLFRLWRAGCIKKLEGAVFNSYGVWQLGDKVYHCGHLIGPTGGFVLTKVETIAEYEESKKNQPNRGGDGHGYGWWPHQIGSTPITVSRLSRYSPSAPGFKLADKFSRLAQDNLTFFDFMPPLAEKTHATSKPKRDASQGSPPGSQSAVLSPSELRVSGSSPGRS